jgi:hypothetical protein
MPMLRLYSQKMKNLKKIFKTTTVAQEQYLNISVLQGTTLGPILFLCYINDLFTVSKLALFLFADDTTCLSEHQDLDTLVNFVNEELEILTKWFTRNKLALNINKTKYIIFRTKGKRIVNPPPIKISGMNLKRVFNDAEVEEDRSFKLLGIYLDEYLNFDKNTDILCAKLSRANFCLRRSANVIPTKSLKDLYFALVHPHLLYCINVYTCTSQKNLNRIKLLQKKAIRIVSKAKYNAHTGTLFKTLNILPFDLLIRNQRLKFMHSIYYDYCPKSYIGFFQKRDNRNHDYNLRENNMFTVPIARIEHFKKFPSYAFVQVWNNAGDVIYHQNQVTFKVALSYELFSSIVE